MNSFLNKFFHLEERGTKVSTELIAGLTTFATMSYILIVQANFMAAAGMNGAGIMLTTALISGLATLVMGLYSSMPFALAPGIK